MRRRSAAVAIHTICAGLVLAASAAAAPFSLEEVLSAPYPSQLVAAERADRIAWAETERGARSLWTAAAPAYAPVELVRYAADDGQPLGGLALSADGALLVYVRGGGPNPAGESPNPASSADGAERAIWAVATTGGEARRVAAGGGPVLAPDGSAVVFAQGGKVLRAALAPPAPAGGQGESGAEALAGDAGESGAEAAAGAPAAGETETLFQARGSLGGLVFSPDGARLAFVSDRGDHAFVGVFALATRDITWIAPGVDRDSLPLFSPDGARLAFLRSPGGKMGELPDLTAGIPFAVWVGDPVAGTAGEVWRSPGADGGFAQFYPDQPLAWTGPERLAFTSEHGGWLHLFAVPVTGGEAVDLTPGEGEVESFRISADGRWAYFWGNHGDLARRRAFRVASTGGVPEPLTPADLLAYDPVPLAGGAVAVRLADARRPPAVALVPAGGGPPRTLAPRELPAGFPGGELAEPQQVSFAAADGVEVHGQLFLPPGAAAGDRRPAVIFLHGGPVRQMLPGWHYRGYYANAYAFNQYLTRRGYVVLALNFRTGIGYGRAFRQAPEQGPRGAVEYRDLVAAGRYLQRRPEVDAQRLGLWGGSYGGYLTALGLARDSALFAAGVDLHGVHDWAWRGEHFAAPGGFWGLTRDDLELARRSSPVADLSLWTSPVLFVHGDDDRNVDFIQTTDLVQRLRERGLEPEVLVFPDEVHGFLRHANWLATFRAAADFFDRSLAAP